MNIIKKAIQERELGHILKKSRSRYRVEFGGKYKKLIKEDPTLAVKYVDPNDRDEVNYMFGVYLLDPDVKIFVEMCDGTEMKIKLGKRRRIKINE